MRDSTAIDCGYPIDTCEIDRFISKILADLFESPYKDLTFIGQIRSYK